ncbi:MULTISPECIES: hypothetical protein [Bacillus cereus group]|uniref:Uncharacterized protein n=1 Tax=Bacillus cereus TaxID=1396 RepID=A0A1Q4L4E5_BACCE|nr:MULTISPECIES: hypothetical protein [Bacillus cereus group]EJP83482.1 hypothetical protein IAU_05462 [Bacillus cereus IS075]EOO82449.1 hypothetical protein IGS_05806 [Bacillus cereus IS845/00]EOO92548.1 hypothetical protein IGQ_05755 [Bacillus cereus IS195]MDX5927870.1 hypothetical protein [Bacillus cereus group sp. BfR-BA-00967]MDX5974997.1 hypothetical protein [Bacillus cereus group sp. BfR-BA-00287]
MNIVNENQKSNYFFDSFFENHPIENNLFVIEANEKYFFFEHDTVIDMIKNFAQKDQDYIRRQLQLYNYLNQDLRICLMQIASDYIRRLIGKNKKTDCKILPLQSVIHCN